MVVNAKAAFVSVIPAAEPTSNPLLHTKPYENTSRSSRYAVHGQQTAPRVSLVHVTASAQARLSNTVCSMHLNVVPSPRRLDHLFESTAECFFSSSQLHADAARAWHHIFPARCIRRVCNIDAFLDSVQHILISTKEAYICIMSLPIGYLTVMARFTIRHLISQNEVMKNAFLNKPADCQTVL
jgi:hypothetical protein